MHRDSFSKLTLIILVILLTACGQNISNRPSAVGVASPQARTGLNVTQWRTNCIYFDEGSGLVPPSSQGNIVLTKHQPKYDSGELQEMVAWAEGFYGRGSGNSTLPNTLTRLQGGPVGVSGWPVPAETGCYGTLRLTNTGNNPVQIQSLDVRLAATPQQNKLQYHLVDICSLLKIYDCPGGRAGPGPLSYHVQLNPGNVGKLFSLQGNPKQELDVLQPTIYPNDVVDIEIFFDSSPKNLIYSIIPDIVYSTTDRPNATLSLLSSTLFFADSSHFSCYTLQGDTFVDVSKIKLTTWKGWCI